MANAPQLTGRQIEEYLDLLDQVKALRRQASDISKKADEYEATIVAFVEAKGGKARTCTRSGFVLAIKEGSGPVPWKHEFIRLAGVDAAEQLIANAPPKEILSVERIA